MALTQLYIMKCDTTLTQELPGFPVVSTNRKPLNQFELLSFP